MTYYDTNKRNNNIRYWLRRLLSLCVKCGKPAKSSNKTLCRFCADKRKRLRKGWKKHKKKRSIYCSNPECGILITGTYGKKFCKKCTVAHRIGYKSGYERGYHKGLKDSAL